MSATLDTEVTEPATVLEDTPAPDAGPTPEEALAASRTAIQRAEAAALAAQQREAAAQAALREARQSQQLDQAAVLGSAVEASTAERDGHARSWQAAMEAGDFAAASKHQVDMMLATARLERASGELAMANAAKERQPPARQESGGNALSPAVREWIEDHPEFKKPGPVRDGLLAMHQQLFDSGTREGSRYFRALDAEYDRLTGNGDMQQERPRNNGGSFGGAPPSRGSGRADGASSGERATLIPEVGTIFSRQSGGQMSIRIPFYLRELMDEGAKISGFLMPDGRTPDTARYAKDFIDNGNRGLITSEGKKYQ
jgi:hypothetical protein